VTGAVAVAVLLVVLLAELHVLAVARNRRIARRRQMLAPLMASLYLAFALVVAVTIGEALGAR
jgi:Na+/alanine symporter